MYLKSLQLENFRNYAYNKFDFIPGVNIILGENAIGKTNILEAVHMMTGTGSFRSAKKADMIMWKEPYSILKASVVSRDRDFELELNMPLKGTPYSKVNGVKKPVTKGLSDVLACTVFAPDDLFIVSAGPSMRRDFMDRALKQLRPNYGSLLLKYQKLMDGKNKILKNWESAPQFRDILPDYTEKMAMLSAQIIAYRHNFIQAIEPIAQTVQSEISSGRELLCLKYKTISTVTDTGADFETIFNEIMLHARKHELAEIASGVCLTGIHKDDIEIELGGRSAKGSASQGQTRTAALSLKLAEHSLFHKVNGEYPVLLLDDVFSELDEKRRDYIMSKTQAGQVIITSCYEEGDRFPESANIIRPFVPNPSPASSEEV